MAKLALSTSQVGAVLHTMESITLPPDFEEAALAQFDGLLHQGRLLFQPAQVETVECESGFKVS